MHAMHVHLGGCDSGCSPVGDTPPARMPCIVVGHKCTAQGSEDSHEPTRRQLGQACLSSSLGRQVCRLPSRSARAGFTRAFPPGPRDATVPYVTSQLEPETPGDSTSVGKSDVRAGARNERPRARCVPRPLRHQVSLWRSSGFCQSLGPRMDTGYHHPACAHPEAEGASTWCIFL